LQRTGCDEDQIAALHQTHDLAAALFCSLATVVRDATRTQAPCHLFADVQRGSQAFELGQCLRVCVDRSEAHAVHTGLNHAQYRISSCSTNSDNFDHTW